MMRSLMVCLSLQRSPNRDKLPRRLWKSLTRQKGLFARKYQPTSKEKNWKNLKLNCDDFFMDVDYISFLRFIYGKKFQSKMSFYRLTTIIPILIKFHCLMTLAGSNFCLINYASASFAKFSSIKNIFIDIKK